MLEGTELETLQLRALQERFAELSAKIPAVHDLAARKGVKEIIVLNDILPVLFIHS
ncbi:MAG: hypothetical protein ACFFAU_18925 [Candidatus Hodarchaeota archaeon]